MLSWITKKLSFLKPGKKNSSTDSSVFKKKNKVGVKWEDNGLNILSIEEESRRKNNGNSSNGLQLSTLPHLPPTPSSPSVQCLPRDTHVDHWDYWSVYGHSETPATCIPHTFTEPHLQSPRRQQSPPSNTQTRSFTKIPDLQDKRASQNRQPSFCETAMSRGSRQGTMTAAKSTKVGQIDQREEDDEVLGSNYSQNSYPSCFLAAALTNHDGELVTVKGKRYVQVRFKGKLLMVSLGIGPLGEAPCRVVWQSGKPVPLVELPDLTCVKIDAFMSPGSETLHAVVVWQKKKPNSCLQLLDNTYIFLDSQDIKCKRKSLDIVLKKISIVFNGSQISAEICDAVVFVGIVRVTMLELLQLGFDEFYATVFKVLEGTGSGQVLYVCTCLWVEIWPPKCMLPMVIDKQKLYSKCFHGLYDTLEESQTLYCDLDATLSVSKGIAIIKLEVDGSSRSLVATHLLSLQDGKLKEYETVQVSVHVIKEICGRKEEWSAVMIKLPSLTGIKATPTWLAMRHLTPGVNECTPTQVTSVSSTQKASVPSKVRASGLIVQDTSIAAVQKVVVPSGQKNAIPPKQKCAVPVSPAQKTDVNVGQKICVPVLQKTTTSTRQKTSVPAAQKTTASTGQKAKDKTIAKEATVPSPQKHSIPAKQKSSILALQKTEAPAAHSVIVPTKQFVHVPAGQNVGVPSAQDSTASNGKIQQNAILSQVFIPTTKKSRNGWYLSLESEYLTCGVLASDPSSAVVAAVGKKILVAKSDLFVNEALLSKTANVALMLKKFPNLGVILTRSRQQHHVLGHSVGHVALVAWAGKKPDNAQSIANKRLSSMKKAEAPEATLVQPTAPFMAAAKLNATAARPSATITTNAGCSIETVKNKNVRLLVRSRYLPDGCGIAYTNLDNMYLDGIPVTLALLKELNDEMWNCEFCIKDSEKKLTVPLAWLGKKPRTDVLSGSSGSQSRQALSISSLSDDHTLSPLASKSSDKKGNVLTPSFIPSKVRNFNLP